MESLLFMLNSFAMVFLIYMSLRDERRAPDDPHTSFFRMTEGGGPVQAAPQPKLPIDESERTEPIW